MKKRVFSFLLVLAMLVTLVTLPTYANDELADNLIIHYDFEGSNEAERLRDKATGGSVSDNLVNYGAAGGIKVENGMATSVVANTRSMLYAPASDDILATGEGVGTWFIRFKSTSAGNLLDLRQNGVGRPLYLELTAEGKLDILQSGVSAPTAYQKIGTVELGYDFTEADWCNLFVRRYLKNGIYYHYQVFYSYGDGVDFQSSAEFVLGNTNDGLVPTEYPLGLYNQYNATSGNLWPINSGLTYDDVRYYTESLNWAAMTGVIQNSSFGSPSVKKALTIHYDFEGATLAEKLKDKAAYGKSADNLTFSGSEAKYSFEKNGKMTSQSGATSVCAAPSLDLENANQGEGTWFVRFSATNAENHVIMDFRNTSISRPLYLLLEADGQLSLSIGSGTSYAQYQNLNIFENPYAFDGSFVNLALVRKWDTDVSRYYYYFYYSIDDSSNFVYSGVRLSNNTAELTSAVNIPFGLFNHANTTWTSPAGLTYDDVRYYTLALSDTELGSIISDDICATTKFYGYQTSDVYVNDKSEEVYDLRLIATIDSTEYTAAGFNVTLGSNTTTFPTSCCFTSLLAKEANTGKMTQLSAPDGTYFIAVVIQNVPASVKPTLAVSSFVTGDATVSSNVVGFTVVK